MTSSKTAFNDEELVKRLREIDGWVIFSPHVHLWAKRLVDDAVAEERAKLAATCERLEAALRDLIGHTHNCEKELTEKLHGADFCGESLPLTNARAALAELKGGKGE